MLDEQIRSDDQPPMSFLHIALRLPQPEADAIIKEMDAKVAHGRITEEWSSVVINPGNVIGIRRETHTELPPDERRRRVRRFWAKHLALLGLVLLVLSGAWLLSDRWVRLLVTAAVFNLGYHKVKYLYDFWQAQQEDRHSNG